ncbi:DUF1127 domain-containing protein [Boseongicola aestuarii]|uniref:YjiS-like domain-containing protein n=1 Tax=Boseongicola aestuarii TaxID=1470561 RepID=A0A238IZM1_9RHOB|nr:DUF1127 domain-containing protein [Boseongicola aestuarii]SMX23104.1 hypothetical protein BOA8489_01206 [Boseongicola aestuarii]
MTDFTCDHIQPSQIGHPLFDLSNKLAARIRARQQRRKLAELMALDRKTLRDIGLTRKDVAQTLAQPLSVDAQTELYRIAYLNGRNLM